MVKKNKYLTSRKYEELVHNITVALYELSENDPPINANFGKDNKWAGISGFQHQIDVSVEGLRDVIMIECKQWNSQVDVPVFLTFLARILDIRAKEAYRSIHPIVVTTIGFDNGVSTLADYYGIECQLVLSEIDFGMKFKNLGYFGGGIEMSRKVSISVDVEVIRKKDGIYSGS